MQARLTLIGTERELNRLNKSITDSWELENESFNPDTLLASIVTTGGRFEVLYSDPLFFYEMCGYFWDKYKSMFEKWFDVLDLEYNPIENYDRYENSHDDIVDNGSQTFNGNTKTQGLNVIAGQTTSTGSITENNTITNEVSAFDSSSYSPHDKSTNSGTTNSNGSTTENKNITTSEDVTTGDAGTTANDRDIDHGARIHGNVGVTTSQQMVEAELKLRAWSIYQHITDIFCKELLICVY